MPGDGSRAGSERSASTDRRGVARESHLTCGRHPGSGGETRVPSRSGHSQQQKAGLLMDTLAGSDSAAAAGVATAAVIAKAVSVMATSRRIRVLTGTSVGWTGADVTLRSEIASWPFVKRRVTPIPTPGQP